MAGSAFREPSPACHGRWAGRHRHSRLVGGCPPLPQKWPGTVEVGLRSSQKPRDPARSRRAGGDQAVDLQELLDKTVHDAFRRNAVQKTVKDAVRTAMVGLHKRR